jgi:ribonuclease HII
MRVTTKNDMSQNLNLSDMKAMVRASRSMFQHRILTSCSLSFHRARMNPQENKNLGMAAWKSQAQQNLLCKKKHN